MTKPDPTLPVDAPAGLKFYLRRPKQINSRLLVLELWPASADPEDRSTLVAPRTKRPTAPFTTASLINPRSIRRVSRRLLKRYNADRIRAGYRAKLAERIND